MLLADSGMFLGRISFVRLRSLIFRYAAFAVLATICNLAVQRLILQLDDTGFYFSVAVFLGTLVGLIVKYILDKQWIFHHHNYNCKAEANSSQFLLYSSTGVFTTIVFWATETLFWLVFSTNFMREIGAIVGLSIGYLMKYQLDRRYVFTDKTLSVK